MKIKRKQRKYPPGHESDLTDPFLYVAFPPVVVVVVTLPPCDCERVLVQGTRPPASQLELKLILNVTVSGRVS